jgi:zinc D-Ala-D-Ala carboxypeptidase
MLPVNKSRLNVKRKKMASLTEHFTIEEMMCPCCKVLGVRPEFLIFIEKVRVKYGKAMKITSAFRCEKHNEKVGGSKTSAHMSGLACDVSMTDSQARLEFIKAAIACGVKGLGLHKSFIHVDIMARPTGDPAWFY